MMNPSINVLRKPHTSVNRLRWTLFAFLTVIFFFSQPYDLTYSLKYLNRAQDIENVDKALRQMTAGNVGRQIALSLLAIYAILYLYRSRIRRTTLHSTLGVVVVGFIMWAAASVLWSYDPTLTIKHLIVFGALFVGAVAVADALSARDLIMFAFVNGLFTLILGLTCEAHLGTFRPFEQTYRFGGELNPIYQAYNCGMLVLASLVLAHEPGRRRYLYTLVTCVAFTCLLLTRSRGPLWALLCAAALMSHSMLSPKVRVLCLSAGASVCCLLALVLGTGATTKLETVALLDRQDSEVSDLSGRVFLWKACYKLAERSPILGYGYDSFWTEEHFIMIASQSGVLIADTHNGYLDILLGLGIPGLMLFIAVLTMGAARAWALLKRANTAEHRFACSIIVFCALNLLLLATQFRPLVPSFVTTVVLVGLASDSRVYGNHPH